MTLAQIQKRNPEMVFADPAALAGLVPLSDQTGERTPMTPTPPKPFDPRLCGLPGAPPAADAPPDEAGAALASATRTSRARTGARQLLSLLKQQGAVPQETEIETQE